LINRIMQEFRKISPNIYYLTSNSDTDRPILAIITGQKRNLIIDAGNSADHAELLTSNINQCGLSKQETFFVTTHWHWDHVFGAHYFPYPFIAHEKTSEKLKEMQSLEWSLSALDQRIQDGQEIEFCAEMMKREYSHLSDIKIRIPDIEFQTRIKIDLGGVDCIVEKVGGDHSLDSTVIYVPQYQTLFLGDCMGANIYLDKWEYQPDNLKKLIQTIRGYKANLYVESHGEPLRAEDFLSWLDILWDLSELTVKENGVGEKIKKAFRAKYARELTNDDEEDLTYLINGWARQCEV